MTAHHLLMYAPLIALLVWAAIDDVRTRRIANWLTGSLAMGGFMLAASGYLQIGLGASLLGALVGFALPFLLFALRALGGGDVKLFAAVGAWLGATGALQVFLFAGVVGLIIVITQGIVQGKLTKLFRNSAILAINLMHVHEVGAQQVMQTGTESRSVDKPLPYAVPILAATLFVMFR